MAAPLEVRQKQRAVIEFLVAERETPVNIHRRLKKVYKDKSLDYSNVCRWVRRLNEKSSLADMPRSGRPSTSVNPANKERADALIRADRCITIDGLASELGVSHGSAHDIIDSLGYSKVGARWVPKHSTNEH